MVEVTTEETSSTTISQGSMEMLRDKAMEDLWGIHRGEQWQEALEMTSILMEVPMEASTTEERAPSSEEEVCPEEEAEEAG